MDKTKLDILISRMSKLNIKLELVGNYPWIYLHKVNNNLITEKYLANHGFTIAFLPIKKDQKLQLTNISEIFKIIRKYK